MNRGCDTCILGNNPWLVACFVGIGISILYTRCSITRAPNHHVLSSTINLKHLSHSIPSLTFFAFEVKTTTVRWTTLLRLPKVWPSPKLPSSPLSCVIHASPAGSDAWCWSLTSNTKNQLWSAKAPWMQGLKLQKCKLNLLQVLDKLFIQASSRPLCIPLSLPAYTHYRPIIPWLPHSVASLQRCEAISLVARAQLSLGIWDTLSIPTPVKDSWAKFKGKTSDVWIFVILSRIASSTCGS